MWVFAFTIFLSAFLLFQVQPLIAKYILPWYGGTSGVWTTCMVFFQVLLVAGYGYAHVLTSFFKYKWQFTIHLIALVSALFFLPIFPDSSFKPVGNEEPTWQILRLLLFTVGVPYLLISSTAPLLQSWFRRAYPNKSPYILYSLSNAGSLLGLLLYPFAIEPTLTRYQQIISWSIAFGVFVLFCILTYRSHKMEADNQPISEGKETIQISRIILWVVLPFLTSVMLLSVTNQICLDIASIPFLWILPLSLYLISFILCFSHTTFYPRWALFILLPAVVSAMIYGLWLGTSMKIILQISIYCAGIFIFSMICHGEVYRLKPKENRLTLFYLSISIGGALGAIFVGILSPILFSKFYELHIAIALTCFFIFALGYQIKHFSKGSIYSARNFYGIINVMEIDRDKPSEHQFVFLSGSIIHGLQFTDPEKKFKPISYFTPNSGAGLTMQYFSKDENRRIGVVGLGIGILASYAKPTDYFRFYEINPLVQKVATEHFSYLSHCPAKFDIILGDGRLSLEREESQNFDILFLDAFSSDSVPMHLLTKEAMEIYLRHIKLDGTIAFNISNKHLNLLPVLIRLGQVFNMKNIVVDIDEKKNIGQYASRWIILSKNKDFFQSDAIKNLSKNTSNYPDFPIWTDDFSNLFGVLQ